MSTQTCRGPECDRPVYSPDLGLCKSHAGQHYRHRPLTPLRQRGGSREGTCEMDGCTDPIAAKRLCNKHYIAHRKPAPAPRPTTCIGPECDRPVQVVKRSMCKSHSKQLMERGDLAKLTPLEAPRGRNVGATRYCTTHPERVVYARGLCRGCYLDVRNGRKPGEARVARICQFTDTDGTPCGRPHHANGWCSTHNQQAVAGNGMWPIGRRPGPTKGTPSPKRGKPRSRMPAGWNRKTKRTKPSAPVDPTGQFAIVDFLVPTLPQEMYAQARRNLHAWGADDLLDMLGLDGAA